MKVPKIVVAPNSFKGSLSGTEAARTIAKGIKRTGKPCDILLFPVADGGSDTMKLLTNLWEGEFVDTTTVDPWGNRLSARYGFVHRKNCAIIGLSEASGLHLKTGGDRRILGANTFGTGVQIKEAVRKGAKKIFIGAGGSATTDGGSGLLQALGIRFLDAGGKEIIGLPGELNKLERIEDHFAGQLLKGCEITVLCDVDNPLLGQRGAAKIFGPQKGASPQEIQILERRLEQFCEVTKQQTRIDLATMKYAGAAGGAAGGIAAWLGGKPVSGIEFILNTFRFDELVRGAEYVITAEGKFDSQSLSGKGTGGVLNRAARLSVPVVIFAGTVEVQLPGARAIPINQSDDTGREMLQTRQNLEKAAFEWAKGTLS